MLTLKKMVANSVFSFSFGVMLCCRHQQRKTMLCYAVPHRGAQEKRRSLLATCRWHVVNQTTAPTRAFSHFRIGNVDCQSHDLIYVILVSYLFNVGQYPARIGEFWNRFLTIVSYSHDTVLYGSQRRPPCI